MSIKTEGYKYKHFHYEMLKLNHATKTIAHILSLHSVCCRDTGFIGFWTFCNVGQYLGLINCFPDWLIIEA